MRDIHEHDVPRMIRDKFYRDHEGARRRIARKSCRIVYVTGEGRGGGRGERNLVLLIICLGYVTK